MSEQEDKIWDSDIEETMQLFLDTIQSQINERESKIDSESLEYFRASTRKILSGIDSGKRALSQYERNQTIENFEAYLDIYTEKVIEQNQQFVKKHSSEYGPNEYLTLILSLRDYIKEMILPVIQNNTPIYMMKKDLLSIKIPIQTLFDGIYNNPVYQESLSKMNIDQKGKLIHIAGQFCPDIMRAEFFPENEYGITNGSILKVNLSSSLKSKPSKYDELFDSSQPSRFSNGDEFFVFYAQDRVTVMMYEKQTVQVTISVPFDTFMKDVQRGNWIQVL